MEMPGIAALVCKVCRGQEGSQPSGTASWRECGTEVGGEGGREGEGREGGGVQGTQGEGLVLLMLVYRNLLEECG